MRDYRRQEDHELTELPAPINSNFYLSLFSTTDKVFKNVLKSPTVHIQNEVRRIVKWRLDTQSGLDLQDAAHLLLLLKYLPDDDLRNLVVQSARQLRTRFFERKFSAMVPIEMSSYCASNCRFCGWRIDNRDAIRLKISAKALEQQVAMLAKIGFSHFEIASGDDIPFVKNDLGPAISLIKGTANQHSTSPRVSICVTPLLEEHYKNLKQFGLDAVITWQETYDPKTFNRYVTRGPKANGLDKNFKIVPRGNGYLARMSSQEYAVRSGLQVGIGCMLGLSTDFESDILSVISHGQKLLIHYNKIIEPLIVGLPTWNEIPTKRTDNIGTRENFIEINEIFELISAIYLLSFPDNMAWVFPNCRVPRDIQVNAVLTAGCFTSTMVRLSPGAYLNNISSENFEEIFVRSSVNATSFKNDDVLQAEQFSHHYHQHDSYMEKFSSLGLELTSDSSFLVRSRG